MAEQGSRLREQMRRVRPMMAWREIGDVPRAVFVGVVWTFRAPRVCH